MEENLQKLSNIELIHKLRKESKTISLEEGNEIVLILLERLVVANEIYHPDPRKLEKKHEKD